ncbi:MAG: hypothetical protein ACRDAM_10865 [Casimicrobium sp.]
MKKLLILIVLFCANAAHAQDKERAVIVPKNNYQAYAASVQAAHESLADQCESKADALTRMAQKCTSDICLALFADKVERACDTGNGLQSANAAPPPEEKGFVRQVWDGLLETARVAYPFVERVVASRERREANRFDAQSKQALYNAFTGMHDSSMIGMLGLGRAGIDGVTQTATQGFRSNQRTASDAFASMRAQAAEFAKYFDKPQIVVNGNCNGVNTGSGTVTASCDQDNDTDSSNRSVVTTNTNAGE